MIPGNKKLRNIRIEVIKGTVNKGYDLNGMSDAFVKIGRLDNNGLFDKKWFFTTTAIKDTLKPEWNEIAFEHLDVNGKDRRLQVEMWDKDVVKDDFIGSAIIELALDDRGAVRNLKRLIEVYPQGDLINPSGCFTIQFEDFGEVEAGENTKK